MIRSDSVSRLGSGWKSLGAFWPRSSQPTLTMPCRRGTEQSPMNRKHLRQMKWGCFFWGCKADFPIAPQTWRRVQWSGESTISLKWGGGYCYGHSITPRNLAGKEVGSHDPGHPACAAKVHKTPRTCSLLGRQWHRPRHGLCLLATHHSPACSRSMSDSCQTRTTGGHSRHWLPHCGMNCASPVNFVSIPAWFDYNQ